MSANELVVSTDWTNIGVATFLAGLRVRFLSLQLVLESLRSSPPLGGPQYLTVFKALSLSVPSVRSIAERPAGVAATPSGTAAPPLANRRLGRRVTSRRFSQTNGFRGERWAPPRRAGCSVRLSGGERARPPAAAAATAAAAAASGCAAPAGAGAQVGWGRGGAWREGSAVGVLRRRPRWPLPAPSRRLPALLGRGAGGGGGGALGVSGAGARWPAPPPGRPQPAHWPGAERPRGPRKVERAGRRQPGPQSGLKLRRSRIGREEVLDRLSQPPWPAAGEEVGLWVGVASPGRARLGSATVSFPPRHRWADACP